MGVTCSCAEEARAPGAEGEARGPESDDVKQRNDEGIPEQNLVPTVPVLEEPAKNEEATEKVPSKEVPEKSPETETASHASGASAHSEKDEAKWQRRDYFLQMTSGEVTAALASIIENPSKVEDFYTIKDKLGAGQFGTVSTGIITTNGVERAVKMIEKKDNYVALKALKAEIEIMKMLDHPNLVAICEIFEDATTIYLAMKLCKGSHLTLYVDRVASLSEKQAAYVMRDMFRAVAYMHNANVAHRDLKGENCLMLTQAPPERNRLKLCDFGLSTTFAPGKPLKGRVGSISHIAPEVLLSPDSYTCACDNWSCGIIFYHVICGFLPYHEEKDVLKGKLSFADRHWCDVSEECCRLVSRFVERDVEKRMTAQEALSHKWFLENTKAQPSDPPPRVADAESTNTLDGTPSSSASFKEISYAERVLRFRGFNKWKQSALRIIASMLPESENNTARDFFLALDVECRGQVAWESFCEASGFEHDGSAQEGVTFTELIAATFDRKRGLSEKMCRAAYQSFDKSGDQQVSLKDLEEGRLIGQLSPKDFKRVIRDLGEDVETVDFGSFMKMLRVDKIRKSLLAKSKSTLPQSCKSLASVATADAGASDAGQSEALESP